MRSDVEIPAYQPFYLTSVADLRAEIERLGVDVPVAGESGRLAQSLEIRGRRVPNRFCAQPIAGHDADAGGAPGELTKRRYRRYAEGGFGLIWMEATAAGPDGQPKQLALHPASVDAFRVMAEEMRAAAPDEPAVILQLVSERPEQLAEAALLAEEAGFDGVDLRCARALLPSTLAAVRAQAPGLLLATRLCAYEGVRGGFGVCASDYRKLDLSEPVRLVQSWRAAGLDLLNVTSASPVLRGPERGLKARSDFDEPDEHPLMALERQLHLARALREAAPGLPVVGSGLSWLRHLLPYVAEGALREGCFDFAGMGRSALAYPFAPRDYLEHGRLEPGSACIVCHGCTLMHREGEPVGCVIRDGATYGPVYRAMRRFDADQLLAGAARCHLCEAAPCVGASPTRTDIPAFIAAFRAGDESRAYEIIRQRDVLPELTSRLAPGWMESEGACIETTLTGTPVPILDLQYAVAWRARERGQTGARVPEQSSGKRVAIAGGGPAGLAAAIRLVELGHAVDLYEASDRLGGAPARVIPASRRPDPQPEIEALLAPAIAAERLCIHLRSTVGTDVPLKVLEVEFDAVLVATGLWQERSLGRVPGVIGALDLLEFPAQPVPARVALLAGGDSAMDAARALQARGATEIFVIFGGPRSAMHWHMPESWFATPGVHAMMNCEPLGYTTAEEGHVAGVRLRQAQLGVESALPVTMVVEAMELQVPDGMRAALAGAGGRIYTAGALVNGGASVSRCVAEGLAAAEAIHHDLLA